MYKHKIRVLHFSFYTVGWKKGGMTVNYRVLLFYKYTTIEDPESFAKEHLAFGKKRSVSKVEFLLRKKESTERFLERLKQRMPIWKKWKRTPVSKRIYYKNR